MQPISRRRALQLGGLGVAGVIVGGAGLTWAGTAGFSPVHGDNLTEPTVLTSAGGTLTLTLEAAAGTGTVAGRGATTLRYNGGVPGPTLRLRPGDHLRVDLVNHLDQPTNLHTHGLQVSPQGNSDNPFLMVEPGETFRYDYLIPTDHPAGTFWYHPHHHGLAADQVFAGLYGAIVIDDTNPPAVTADRVLLISDITLDAAGHVQPVTPMQRMAGREGEMVLVNGQLAGRLDAAPEARERWRIVNACTSRYLQLRLDGQELQLLGLDLPVGGRLQTVDRLLLAPGNRADVLVTMRAGTASLRAMAYDRGSPMGMGGMGSRSVGGSGIELATLTVAGPATAALPGVRPHPELRDLRTEPVTDRRRITLAMNMGGGMGMGMDAEPGGASFTIDGRRFDPGRADQLVTAGAVEEWTIINTSSMDHPFHLHVWPMQVLSIADLAVDNAVWQNVVNVPARSRTIVRIAFDSQTGRTVYHCHILDHEDNGMMGVIDVS